jgi:putative ABC transport system permease protein
MLSIGEGAKRDALEQIQLMGTNNILIRATAPPESKESQKESGKSKGLSLKDAENISLYEELVKIVVPQRKERINRIAYKDKEAKAEVTATTPEYLKLLDYKVQYGRFLDENDNEELAQICVLGAKVKKELFAFENPLGKSIKLDNLWFTVIGVMEEKRMGKSKIEGVELKNLNEAIYIPLKTAMKKMKRSAGGFFLDLGNVSISSWGGGVKFYGEIDELAIQVKSSDKIQETANIIKSILERRHNKVQDYEIVIPEALLRQSQKTQRIFNIVMGAIAGISLLVGGIGIMNIMLASVLERTREIGLRRAVGATRVDILRQFLLEALFISFLGCVIGVGLGFSLAKGIAFYAKWRTIISAFSIILAVGVSAAVGLIFGIFPAKKAAQLDPIEALRYE